MKNQAKTLIHSWIIPKYKLYSVSHKTKNHQLNLELQISKLSHVINLQRQWLGLICQFDHPSPMPNHNVLLEREREVSRVSHCPGFLRFPHYKKNCFLRQVFSINLKIDTISFKNRYDTNPNFFYIYIYIYIYIKSPVPAQSSFIYFLKSLIPY